METMEPNNQNMSDRRTESANNTVSFLALAVAVAALVLAWVVYNNQPGEDFKDTVRTESVKIDQKIEDTAEKTGNTAREGVGAAVEKTGEALEATGEAAQEAGTDIKNDSSVKPQ